MTTLDWKSLKTELEFRGYKVAVKGRSRKEYIAEKGDILINILFGGISGTARFTELYIYDLSSDNLEVATHQYQLSKILGYIDDYN